MSAPPACQCDGEAPREHRVGELRRLLGALPRLGVGGAEGDPEEAELGERVGEALVDERELGLGRAAGQLQELEAVADRAHRAYQVVAEPGADQRAEVGGGHPTCPPAGNDAMNEHLEPGMLVRHPERPDWGLGQVQSMIGKRITVNFEHAGKVVIDGSRVSLEADFGPEADH